MRSQAQGSAPAIHIPEEPLIHAVMQTLLPPGWAKVRLTETPPCETLQSAFGQKSAKGIA